jgi:hypothetical protein
MVGCLVWLAGLAYAKGLGVLASFANADGNHILMGLSFGMIGLALLMWVNLMDTA